MVASLLSACGAQRVAVQPRRQASTACSSSQCSTSGRHVAPFVGSQARHAASGRHVAARALWGSQLAEPQEGEDEYMREYRVYKHNLQLNARKAGGGLAAYLLLTVSGPAALASLVGSAGASLYLAWLFRDIDNVKPTDSVAMLDADKIRNPLQKWGTKILLGYRYALAPRLSVLVFLAFAAWAINQASGAPLDEQPIGTVEFGCMLLGFLSYKGVLLFEVFQATVPKSYGEESSRPKVEVIEDELDRWGRPKRRGPMPTDALPDAIDTSKIPIPEIKE